MQLITNLGYYTAENKWDTMTDKDLAKYNILTEIYTHRGECDWDPLFGTTILDQLFKPKNEGVKSVILEEISRVINNDPRFQLLNIEAQDIEEGWIVYCNVSYLNGTPDYWQLNIVKNNFKVNNGYYSLEDE